MSERNVVGRLTELQLELVAPLVAEAAEADAALAGAQAAQADAHRRLNIALAMACAPYAESEGVRYCAREGAFYTAGPLEMPPPVGP